MKKPNNRRPPKPKPRRIPLELAMKLLDEKREREQRTKELTRLRRRLICE